MRRASPSLSAARWLVGVLGGVIVCFLAASAIAQHYESAIAMRANDIVANAMPSVEQLTIARGELHGLERAVDRNDRARIDEAHQNIEAAIASYVSLPFFRDERALAGRLHDRLAELDALLAQPELDAERVHQVIARVDQRLQSLVSFQAAQGQRLGLEIEDIRGNTRWIIATLDALAVVLAGLAAMLAIRQLVRTERARRAERDALAHEAEVLGHFSGRVAHDILSPLSTTLLSLELARQSTDPQVKRGVERGIRAINRVQTLVDDLLAFSRAGGRPDPGAATALAPVIADVAAELGEQAAQQRIVLEVGVLPDDKVACSAGVLTSLLVNLVQNAIKYMGDAQTRRIAIRCFAAPKRWRIEIEDTGPGIPSDQQRRIFEPYVQLRSGAGIGLGLATVDRLVRAHGGMIGVRSAIGQGATFWFELPAYVEAVEAASASRDTRRDQLAANR